MSMVWQCLEDVPGLAACAAEWQCRLGEDFPVFKTAFLQRTTRQVASVPCPHDCGQVHDVRPRRDGSFVGVCRGGGDDPTCDDILLTTDDVAVWELNWSRFGRAVARGFTCDAKETAFGLPGTVQVASLSDEALPIVLTMQEDRDGFRSLVGQLVARLSRPFILLSPTSRFMDGISQGLLANVKAGFFDLASWLTLLPSGELQARKTGGKLFSPYLATAKERTPDHVTPEYLIKQENTRRRKGRQDRTMVSLWRIWFRGEEILMPESVGTEYMVFLIRQQGREFNAKQLTQIVRKSGAGGGSERGQQANETLYGQDGKADRGEMWGRVGDVNERDVIWDQEQITEASRRIGVLAEEIAQHEEAGDRSSPAYETFKTKLEEQQDMLAANAKQVKGKWVPKEYQKGTFQEMADLIRKHVRKLLDEHLRENCRRLFDHLNDRRIMAYGVKNCYRPEPRINWEFQLKEEKTGT